MKAALLFFVVALFLFEHSSAAECYVCKGGKSNCLNKKNTCETDYDSVCYSLFNRAGVLQEKGCMKKRDLEWQSATPGSCSQTQFGRYCSCKKDYCNFSTGKQSPIYLFVAFMFMFLYV